MGEVKELKTVTCPRCGGSGVTVSRHGRVGRLVPLACSLCGGRGVVQPQTAHAFVALTTPGPEGRHEWRGAAGPIPLTSPPRIEVNAIAPPPEPEKPVKESSAAVEHVTDLAMATAEVLWGLGDVLKVIGDVLSDAGYAVNEAGHAVLDAWARTTERRGW